MENRIEILKSHIMGQVPSICPERAKLMTKSWRETEGEPIPIRRALALKEILQNQTVIITNGELIVGNQAGKHLAAPIFPEYGIDWLLKEGEGLSKRKLDRFTISKEILAELNEISLYWKGKTHFDKVKAESMWVIPEEYLPVWDPNSGNFNNVVTNSGRMTTGDGHVIVNFERIIHTGLKGVIKEAQDEIKKCQKTIIDPESIRKKIFLESVIISMKAAIVFANRYADNAEKMAINEKDPSLKAELMQIAVNCRKVPENPAETLWEALQFYWMMHLILQIESNGHSMSFGRFDQYMQPYYQRDLTAGTITREKAVELVECFMIKCNEIKKIRTMSHTRKMHGYPMFQTLTVGGQNRDGSDATNDFSYITLEATGNTKMQEPTTIARIHPKTSQEFLLACSKTLIKHGGGLPGLFNDEVAVPLLMSTGVTLEDARDWAVDGCCEPLVPGKHNPINGGCCHINLLKILEITMHNGVNPDNGLQLLPGDGTLDQFETFEDFVVAYRKQLDFYISFVPILDAITSKAHADLTPCPFLSGLLDYRIEIGRDAEEGWGPNYNNTLSICHGAVNVGNSLYAMKKVVYDNRSFTPIQLKKALDYNFEGEEGQMIRKRLLEAPKYGNDIDEVDLMVKESINWYFKGIASYTPARGGYYCPSPQTLSANAYTAESIGATPDGRKKGESSADNISPAAGTDLSGATATLKSVAKLDHALATNGTILNMKLHPTAVSGETRISKFTAMIRAYFDLQGFQVQFNIVSVDTLRDAQKNPEKYKNLIVKVAGYSALFTSLDERLQNQIILRTEHVI